MNIIEQVYKVKRNADRGLITYQEAQELICEIMKGHGLKRYFSILRPVGPGTFPKEGMIDFYNFEYGRAYCPEIDREAWAYIWYDRELSEKEMKSYDLMEEQGKMKNEIKEMISRHLVQPTLEKGMSDSKWQKIAEKIEKQTGVSVEEIYEEYESQFKAALQKAGVLN